MHNATLVLSTKIAKAWCFVLYVVVWLGVEMVAEAKSCKCKVALKLHNATLVLSTKIA